MKYKIPKKFKSDLKEKFDIKKAKKEKNNRDIVYYVIEKECSICDEYYGSARADSPYTCLTCPLYNPEKFTACLDVINNAVDKIYKEDVKIRLISNGIWWFVKDNKVIREKWDEFVEELKNKVEWVEQ